MHIKQAYVGNLRTIANYPGLHLHNSVFTTTRSGSHLARD